MYKLDKPDNLVEMFEESVRKHGDNRMFGAKGTDGIYKWVTYREVAARVDRLRGGLAKYGIKKDDVVGLIANNRIEWAIAAFASYGLGARFIPMYESELPHIWKYIITDGSIKVLFAANQAIYDTIKGFQKDIPTLEHIFIIDSEGPLSMAELERVGEANPIASIKPDPRDVAGLIYTSGTTGDPKGVLLTHGNFTSNLLAGIKMYPELGPNDVTLAILPWAHSYAQTGELYAMIHLGAGMGLAENATTIAQDIQVVKPTWLVAVPRVFNKIYEGITSKMNKEGGLAKALFDMGIAAAKRKRELAAQGKSEFLTNIKFGIADKIVFQKIRDKMGGRLKGSMTASAMMNQEIALFFFDIGIPVYDCYGMTETSPAVAMNGSNAYRLGSVGRAIEKVNIVIDKGLTGPDSPDGKPDCKIDGEVIVYGPNVMKGYHNKPEQTKQVMTPDGGIRTGDRGRLDSDGYLYITGRIKEQYKLENGKFVFPASLEEDICLLSCVQNVMVYGENRAFNICLIVPELSVLRQQAIDRGLPSDDESLVNSPEIRDMIAESVTSSLKGKYGGYEIPKKFVLLSEGFSIENGMLTPTLKLKRRVVLEKYMGTIDNLYKGK
jgi:long-chain acyl-CoA synthetase